jgi:hypothetical protein
MHVTFASRQNSIDGAVLVSVSVFSSEVMCEIDSFVRDESVCMPDEVLNQKRGCDYC